MQGQFPWSRRQFLQFLGASTAITSAPYLSGCQSPEKKPDIKNLGITPLEPTYKDDVILASGFQYSVLISSGDKIGRRSSFGYNNDYIAFIPFKEKSLNEGWLWVNHESFDSLFVSGRKKGDPLTKKQVQNEMTMVGGSLLHAKMENGKWSILRNSRLNKRFDARTKIPFADGVKVEGQRVATGTLANCAGGITPWNTVLTCEENYQDFYGESTQLDNGKKGWTPGSNYLMWEKFYKRPPEHYGWVVEINPKTRKAQKLTNLGRFSHESATVTLAKDGRVVVYSGDDKADESIYKFISDGNDHLKSGTLYVADTINGKWLPLDRKQNPRLKKRFSSQLDLLIRTREAGRLAGGTPQNRPEDIAIDPQTGDVLVCLTNNKVRGDFWGQILKIEESNQDSGSLEFKSSTLLAGGDKKGFACPDNIAFGPNGHLWFTTDISGGSIGKRPYESFGNNALFVVPMNGVNAGFAFRVASAPVGSEFTGPCFAPDGKTLFLSVQHPGEKSKSLSQPRSRWPNFGAELPRPSVIAISGPFHQI